MGHTLYTTLHKKVPRCFVHSNPASMLFFSFSLSHVAGGGITIIVEEFIGAKFTNNFFPSLYTTLLYTKPLQQNEDRKQKAEAPRQGKKVTILLGCKKNPSSWLYICQEQEEYVKTLLRRCNGGGGKYCTFQLFFPLLPHAHIQKTSCFDASLPRILASKNTKSSVHTTTRIDRFSQCLGIELTHKYKKLLRRLWFSTS